MIDTARDRALAFRVFLDGLEEAGLERYARVGRAVARDLLDALDMLDAERSARWQLQERVKRLEQILLRYVDRPEDWRVA